MLILYHLYASPLLLALHTRTKYKMATIFGLTYGTKISRQIDECLRHENLERTHNWCSAVGMVAF